MSGLKANNLLMSDYSVRKHAWKRGLESCSGAVVFLLMGSKAKQNNNSVFLESSVIKKSSYIAKQEV